MGPISTPPASPRRSPPSPDQPPAAVAAGFAPPWRRVGRRERERNRDPEREIGVWWKGGSRVRLSSANGNSEHWRRQRAQFVLAFLAVNFRLLLPYSRGSGWTRWEHRAAIDFFLVYWNTRNNPSIEVPNNLTLGTE